MVISTCKKIALLSMCVLSPAVLAVPGGPIGGIIVKGGKNPGGQMLALGTTDANGRFNVKFAESGEYRLEFVGAQRRTAGGQADTMLRVDYRMEARARTLTPDGNSARKSVAQTTSSTLKNAELVLTVPPGGAEVSGTLLGARQQSNR